MNQRHPLCYRTIGAFPFEVQHLRCEVCYELDARHCLGGSHPSTG